ncbi:hypothetical protein PUNSTDRAFT_102890 [Punctularia strigosozonata HHB-11173 SS5]|uniref:uncharacterized protein n=1 Tax=Punctularia strigosozonata (strain HHB-11173) TaxID=741275 RepID=UPI000441754B|nr:uncharacterized protein PUNSTDRAFT_102890 [Punctularia strigosozonata HHB-11173 SS5]EIN08127.1 hypothetical protein PUNSTDRAFT_102890 [Punctularia strigosozonata HHB-11173 SS5]
MTSFFGGGMTNDIMTIGNMVYLATLTDRVPIIPPWMPNRLLDANVQKPLPFGEVFDVPRLARKLRRPVLEWHQVKDYSAGDSVLETIGCYTVWGSVKPGESRDPSPSSLIPLLNLDISWNNMPSSISLGYDTASIWRLASLLYPSARQRAIDAGEIKPSPSGFKGELVLPDDQFTCYDLLYYAATVEPFEYFQDYSPAWRFVVSNFHWTQQVERIGHSYVRRILGVEDGGPNYIAIHARRGDFQGWCDSESQSRDDCLVNIGALQIRVKEIQDELLVTRGINLRDTDVILLSDEKDPQWWLEVRDLGWKTVDHVALETVDIHGPWYPLIVDVYIMSSGIGFVGTARSTMSLLAKRRTEEWRNGITRTVEWGWPGADNH